MLEKMVSRSGLETVVVGTIARIMLLDHGIPISGEDAFEEKQQ